MIFPGHCPLHYSLFGIPRSPLVPLHRSSVASSTATTSTVAASTTATTAIQPLLLSSSSSATSTSIVATTAGAIASTPSAKKSRPTPLSLESISNHNIGTRQSNSSSVCATTTTISHIKLLETIAVDGTFGRLAKEFPNRLSNVHANIGALLKIVTASAGSSSPQQQQLQQPLPSSSISTCRRRDSLRSHLDSGDDDDEVRDSLMPSRKRKVVGEDGLIRMDSKCDSRRRCHKPRMRNTSFDTIKMKKAIWAEFKDRKVSIDVSIS